MALLLRRKISLQSQRLFNYSPSGDPRESIIRKMQKRLIILCFAVLLIISGKLGAQVRSPFTGDFAKFRSELTAFMGPNLNDEQKESLESFLAKWDSTSYKQEDKTRIIDVISQLYGRFMRPVPNFNNFIVTLNKFIDWKTEPGFLTNWLTGLSEIVFDPRYESENIDRYIKNTGLMITDNIISDVSGMKWKVKNARLNFLHDTVFKAFINNATLTCYSQKDSTEIYNVSGVYYPEFQQFHGTKGTVTWEKAGFPGDEVFAELQSFYVNTSKNSFSVDSAKLTHKTYFKTPVLGFLTDQTIPVTNKVLATYPRFETYTKEFHLDNIYQGIDYKGGLAFEGANVKGSGGSNMSAEITFRREDTLFMKIRSGEFMFGKDGLASAEAEMTLYLNKDSVYHSNLAFSFNAKEKQVNLFRANNPVSRSPYFNSFHNLDMYFELLSWNMNESKAILTRAKGASMGQAEFESGSFFNAEFFNRLAGIDEYHPLVRFKRFAEYYYSTTFPVEEFAKWLNKPVETVTGLCIDMANKGFIFYDRKFNEITLKKKVDDFLNSYTKKQDYDVLRINSETKAPVDNAVLDLNNYDLQVNGVNQVFLSDSQRVALYPYNQQLTIGRNRTLKFDGVVEAGLLTFFGHDFTFSYDTFKIRLAKIDSIRVAVETEERDVYGNPVIKIVDNTIQLASAELYIDDPNNKSGLQSLRQYPIINAADSSYIFFDDLPGLQNIYSKKDFYFVVDPFMYENIDHFRIEDMDVSGVFFGGNILSPTRQTLAIQPDNSLGFNMFIPDEGIEIYGSKGRIYDSLNISSKGLVGKGTLKHLTAAINSEELKFYPDSMVAQASVFTLDRDSAGLYPILNSQDVYVKWRIPEDEWLAVSSRDKGFSMFDNGTTLDGSLALKPGSLTGEGIVNTTDSRITSNTFSFTANTVKADSCDYNFKSPSTSGYAFIAEDTRTEINFDLRETRFHLNTDTSMVKFPEIQYICTMTDFIYNQDTRILSMEQKGKEETQLLTPELLLKADFNNLDKPTFFATNVIGDTIAFSSWKARYHVDQEYIEAENINYLHIADALIQPDQGKLTINRRARINQLQNAIVAINNRHLLHSANIDIESTKRYSGSGVYDYPDENKEIQKINFAEISVDSLMTSAIGYIPVNQNFRLSPAFSFFGDVNLSSKKDRLLFSGAAGIINTCGSFRSYPIQFKQEIDPERIMIPISEKPRDANNNLVFSGSFINIDSVHIYPAFLSAQKSWADVAIVNSQGYLYYEKANKRYLISSLEKIADQTLPGNLISFDTEKCILSGEGKTNLGATFNFINLTGAGRVSQTLDSGKVEIQTILGFDFHFTPEGLKMMSDEFRLTPSLKSVNLNSEFYRKGMDDLVGGEAASRLKEQLDLFSGTASLPKEFNFEILLNDVTLYWNEASSSFRSKGKIGLGYIGTQPVNVYVDGFVEIQRRRSGDMFDIYLKASESVYYYFSYISGNMLAYSGNSGFNTLIAGQKAKARRHPGSNNKKPYSYMISTQDRLMRFIEKMTGNGGNENEQPDLDGIVQ